jgi:hypothetical protein
MCADEKSGYTRPDLRPRAADTPMEQATVR